MDYLTEYSEQFRSPYWLIGLRLLFILIAAWVVGPLLARKFTDNSKQLNINYPFWTSVIALMSFIVLFLTGMLRHLTFHSKAWDLAIFDQVIWNLSNGNGWECSVRGVVDLRGDHFEPILYLFVPLYNIFPNVGWLLGIQAAALVGSGVIISSIYLRRLGTFPALMLLTAFCCYPALHWLTMADFHPIALAPFFIAIGWFGSRRNNLWIWLIGVIGMSLCSEEAIIVAGWWSLWEFISRKPWKRNDDPESRKHFNLGWSGLILAGLLWTGFLYLSIVYIPSHRPEGEDYFYVHRYAYLGDSMLEIAKNFFLKPAVWVRHALDGRGWALLALYFIPLALLPVRRPWFLSLLLITGLYTLLSNSPEQRSIFHQYTSIWIPFLFIACAEALRPTRNIPDAFDANTTRTSDVINRRAMMLVTGSFLGMLMFSPLIGLSMHPELITPDPWAPEARMIIETVQSNDAVAAPSALCPHLSHRRVLLLKSGPEFVYGDEIVVLPEFPP